MKLSRTLFTIGNILFILIGVLHTVVHYRTLVASELEQAMSQIPAIQLTTRTAEVWDLWEGQSLTMGILLIVIGLLNIFTLKSLGKTAFPPKVISLIMMILIGFIIYTGFAFFGTVQIYGGIVGLGLYGTALWLAMKEE